MFKKLKTFYTILDLKKEMKNELTVLLMFNHRTIWVN